MGSKKSGWPVAILAFLAILYLIFQIIRSTTSFTQTEMAQNYTADETISVLGYVIRNESLVKNTDTGVLRYTTEDGGRVAKNGVIAEVYTSKEQAHSREEVINLEKQIAELKRIQSKQAGVTVPIDILEKQIFDGYLSSLRLSEQGDFAQRQTQFLSVLSLLNRKQIILGETENFGSRISKLENKIAQLKSKDIHSPKNITTDYAGYFVRQADGYESIISFEKAHEITTANLEVLKQTNKSPTEDIVGKIVRDYEWYIIAEVSSRDTFKLPEGSSINLELPFSQVDKLPVTIKSVNRDEETGKAVVVFLCSYMNSEIAVIRNQPIEILMKKHTGLRIPRKAVRVIKGVQGVYVLKGTIAHFKPVEIIYTASDYFIIKSNDKVALFDEIITKGKGLNDGKIVG